MRIYDPETQAILNGGGAIIARRLVWIEAENTASGEVEGLGLWSGEDHKEITIGGDVRQYLGMCETLGVEPINASAGLTVRTHQLRLAAIHPVVENLVKGFETFGAPVEVHRVFLDPVSRLIVGTPHRVFRGVINTVDFPTAQPGEMPDCVLDVVSETRALTSGLPLKKSDGSQQERGGDRLRRYGDISGSVPVYWGELQSEPPVESPNPLGPGAGNWWENG